MIVFFLGNDAVCAQEVFKFFALDRLNFDKLFGNRVQRFAVLGHDTLSFFVRLAEAGCTPVEIGFGFAFIAATNSSYREKTSGP